MKQAERDTENELWRCLGEWPYSVSDHGRVLSHRTNRILKPYVMPNGYHQVKINGQKCYVHVLVATFVIGGKPSPAHEVAHNDGNKGNNRASNLRWATRSDNHMDKVAHGTMLRGEKHSMAKLTEEKVLEIRRRVSAGERQKDLAAETGMSKMAISRAVRGENWGHVHE